MHGAHGRLGALAATIAASLVVILILSRPHPTAGQSLEDARDALAQEHAVVAVLGDSTGNDTDEWVMLWMDLLREERAVAHARWDATTETWSDDLDGLDAVQVWNGSVAGSQAHYAVERIEEQLPRDVDLVIINHGHNHDVDDVDQVRALIGAVDKRASEAVVVILLQQPQMDDANKEVREAVADIARETGVPTINIAAAFEQDGRELAHLLRDDIHPNGEGSLVWAKKVAQVLP